MRRRRPNFLPTVNLNYLYTPAQRFPLIRIPAGIFGPDEQTFQAAFTRENIMQLDINQPIYTGGRLRNAYGIQASALDASKLELERARQELQYRVVETFYAALMNEQGVRVAEEQIRLAEQQLGLANGALRGRHGRAARRAAGRSGARQREGPPHPGAGRAVDTAYQALRTVLSLPQSQALDAARHARRTVGAIPRARSSIAVAVAARPARVRRAAQIGASTPSQLANGEWKPSLAFTGNMQYQEDCVRHAAEHRQPELHVRPRVAACRCSRAPGAAARRAAAQAQMRQAEHGLNAATDQARLELETAWHRLSARRRSRDDAGKALELARESCRSRRCRTRTA